MNMEIVTAEWGREEERPMVESFLKRRDLGNSLFRPKNHGNCVKVTTVPNRDSDLLSSDYKARFS